MFGAPWLKRPPGGFSQPVNIQPNEDAATMNITAQVLLFPPIGSSSYAEIDVDSSQYW
jgi:hypothetical protein